MPYREDIFEKGGYYHVYNRGINKNSIFRREDDYCRFEFTLANLSEKTSICRIHAYCLMTNHFHLLMEQKTEVPISLFVARLQNSFAKYFNLKYSRIGALFGGRFKALRINSDEQLLQLSKYIHRNPIVAGLTRKLGDYPWSSYSSYISQISKPFVCTNNILAYFSERCPQKDYSSFVGNELDEVTIFRFKDYLIDIEE